MTPPIEERVAWSLVRAVTPGSVEGSTPVRAHLGSDPGVWIEVRESGSWRASGVATEAACDVFDIYLPLQIGSRLVIGQLGQSLDGRIATESGSSHYITGPQDIVRLHRLRALVDAVIVGADTVAVDDPRLTVREAEGENPVRVVVDPGGRLEAGRRVLSDGAARTLVVRRALKPGPELRGDEVHVPSTDSGDLDLRALLTVLRSEGLSRILVEGGGVTVSRFLAAGLLDRLHITIAPLVIGSGRPSIILEPIESLDQALRPWCRRFSLGADTLFDLDLRREGR